MFLSADILVKTVMIEPGLRVAGDVDDLARQDHPAHPRPKATQAGAGADRRCPLAERSAGGLGVAAERTSTLLAAATQEVRMSADSGGGRRHQGTCGVAIFRDPADGSPCGALWHGRHCDDRCDFAVRRPVRHGVGHHEQLHRHFKSADDQSCRRCAGYRRGAARDRDRSRVPRFRRSSSTITSPARRRAIWTLSAAARARSGVCCRAISTDSMAG